MAGFLSAVSGLDWETCQAVIDRHVPGGIAQTVKDADTLFGIELPAISAWTFGPEQAAAIGQPVLSVLGAETVPLFIVFAQLALNGTGSLPVGGEVAAAVAGGALSKILDYVWAWSQR